MANFIPLAPSGQTDPRLLLAQSLLGGNRQASTPGQGIVSALSSILGGVLANRSFKAQEGRQEQRSQSLTEALTAALGKPAETVTQPPGPGADITGGAINFNPQPPNRNMAFQALGRSGDPQLQQFALSQALAQDPKLLSQGAFDQQLQLRTAGRAQTNVNVDTGGNKLPDPPKGFVFARNPDNTVALTEVPGTKFMTPVVVPISGGPAEIKAGAAAEQAEQRETAKVQGAQNVVNTVGRVRSLVKAENFFSPATGVGGTLLANVPGTRARDTEALLATIKANVGFGQLQKMRESSPTGGALGQVSENENLLLQSVIANLEQSQSQPQFLENLKVVEETFLDIIHGGGNRPGGGNGKRFTPDQFVPPREVNLRTLRPFESGEFIDNLDGTRSTERTVSFNIDGKEILAPSLWMSLNGPVDLGQHPELITEAIQSFENRSGKKFPRFNTPQEIREFAEQRSRGGAVFSGPLAKPRAAGFGPRRDVPIAEMTLQDVSNIDATKLTREQQEQLHKRLDELQVPR